MVSLVRGPGPSAEDFRKKEERAHYRQSSQLANPQNPLLADLGKGNDLSSWSRGCLLNVLRRMRLRQTCGPAPKTATRATSLSSVL